MIDYGQSWQQRASSVSEMQPRGCKNAWEGLEQVRDIFKAVSLQASPGMLRAKRKPPPREALGMLS